MLAIKPIAMLVIIFWGGYLIGGNVKKRQYKRELNAINAANKKAAKFANRTRSDHDNLANPQWLYDPISAQRDDDRQ